MKSKERILLILLMLLIVVSRSKKESEFELGNKYYEQGKLEDAENIISKQ